MRPGRAKQCLSKEGVTLERDAAPPSESRCNRGTPRCLTRTRVPRLRFGAPPRCTPWHHRPGEDLRRAACDHPGFTGNAPRDLFSVCFREPKAAIESNRKSILSPVRATGAHGGGELNMALIDLEYAEALFEPSAANYDRHGVGVARNPRGVDA